MKHYKFIALMLFALVVLGSGLVSCQKEMRLPENNYEAAAGGTPADGEEIDNPIDVKEPLKEEKVSPKNELAIGKAENEIIPSGEKNATENKETVNPAIGESTSTEPVPAGIGGDEIYSWMYELRFGIESRFQNLVDEQTANEWNDGFSHVNPNGKRDPETEHNIYNFIHELNIPREAFEEANSRYVKDGIPAIYTKEEIDLLYLDDPKEAYAYFANPYGVQVGKVVYTPEWLETHTAQEYQKVGITHKALSEKLPAITQLFGETLQAESFVENVLGKAQKLSELETDSPIEITPVLPPVAEVK